MIDIQRGQLSEPLMAALRRAARDERLLVACDYDGTLSPIVDDPAAAVPHAPAIEALIGLSTLDGVEAVVISGRSADTLESLVATPRSVRLIGDHGAQLGTDRAETRRTIEAILAALDAAAAEFAGVVVESKSLGGAFHYRHSTRPEQAAAAARAIGLRFGARVIEGKKVVELSVGHGDKGTAIQGLRSQGRHDRIVFFGDDVTDEDAFAVLDDDDISVKVGAGDTRARFRVADPMAVAESLEILRFERRTFRR